MGDGLPMWVLPPRFIWLPLLPLVPLVSAMRVNLLFEVPLSYERGWVGYEFRAGLCVASNPPGG